MLGKQTKEKTERKKTEIYQQFRIENAKGSQSAKN